MKFFIAAILIVSSTALPSVRQDKGIDRVYVYQRARHGGAAPKRTAAEAGSRWNNQDVGNFQWLIFITGSNPSVEPYCVWLSGIPYSVTRVAVQSPVLSGQPAVDPYRHADTLVPPTSHYVWQLVPGAPMAGKNRKRGSKAGAPVVIDYYYLGKKRHLAVSEIKKLAPLVLQ